MHTHCNEWQVWRVWGVVWGVCAECGSTTPTLWFHTPRTPGTCLPCILNMPCILNTHLSGAGRDIIGMYTELNTTDEEKQAMLEAEQAMQKEEEEVIKDPTKFAGPPPQQASAPPASPPEPRIPSHTQTYPHRVLSLSHRTMCRVYMRERGGAPGGRVCCIQGEVGWEREARESRRHKQAAQETKHSTSNTTQLQHNTSAT